MGKLVLVCFGGALGSGARYETLHDLEDGALGDALVYVAATVVGCLLAGVVGFVTARVVARVAAGLAV